LEKVFCKWNAKDAESIKKILETTEWLTTEGVYEMGIVEAYIYRKKLPEITV